ncbi:MAG: hypothetical protein KY460_01310 [Actinobacteria bacterium]|nr:hypothetical protein [Actinomycetota bacterium]
MVEQLRFAVAYWHSFNWTGYDIFGDGTLPRPWLHADEDPMTPAHRKMEVAFEFFCFHDRDRILAELRADVDDGNDAPGPVSDREEMLERIIARDIEVTR